MLISRGLFPRRHVGLSGCPVGPGRLLEAGSNGVPSVLFPQRERQAQREDALELTEKLDQDWKEIQTLLARKTPTSESRGGKEKPKVGSAPHRQPGLTTIDPAFLCRRGGARHLFSLLGLKFSVKLLY